MKKVSKILVLFVFALTILINTDVEAASKVQLNKKTVTLHEGRKVTLKMKGVKSKAIKWSTSNKRIVKVSSSGKVTAMKTGKATITAKYKGKKRKCKVTVGTHSWKNKTYKEIVMHPGETHPVVICVCGAKFDSIDALWAHQDINPDTCFDFTSREETSDGWEETIYHHKRVCSCGAEEAID
ncbi:MAG: Ig-like domain-containing protein [Eubacteriales bacterium]|nr:Ig-like domain-containing protein [Eubacteriales bacterium]